MLKAAAKQCLARLGLARRKPDLSIPAEFQPWFEGKDFTRDNTSLYLRRWSVLFTPHRDRIARVLEIGVLEGRATTFFLEFFPQAKVTCVDFFEHEGSEDRFDRNITTYGERVRKIKARSVGALDELYTAGETFDLIYIDGDHSLIGALVDSALSMRLIAPNGFIIWDDYGYPHPINQPKPGIDAVLALFRKELEVVYRGYQVVAQRRPDAP